MDPERARAALQKRLLGGRDADTLALLRRLLPPLAEPGTRSAWLRRASAVRRRVLDLFMRGHEPGLLRAGGRVEWGAALEHDEYRVRKLRYEGYPGLWVPALLYEPRNVAGRVPAVLNPNGHHAGGKAMDYKQARCINLAKRGMLALNTEFIGMGELRADAEHNRIAHLDLCGVAGVGVFYLLMKRGLDALLAHPAADAGRVAVTGLSGGGWQTAVLAALDERVTAIAPVAGHSPMWQRAGCVEDIGDLEQCPADLGAVADYDVLTALFAPRPTLLIYNRDDDCCFQTRRTRRSIYRPAKKYFDMLGGRIELYDNTDPGTHNYEADNRARLYRFLDGAFGLDTPAGDLPWRDELHTEAELNVGLPPDNATLLSLAQQTLVGLRRRRGAARPVPSQARRRLARLLRLPVWKSVEARSQKPATRRGGVLRQHLLRLDADWVLPLTEASPAGAREAEVYLGDGGRAQAPAAAGRRLFAVDVLGSGEKACSWQHHMLLASSGARPLGIQVGQVLAVVDWVRRYAAVERVHLRASGPVLQVAALAAAALRPAGVASLHTAALMDSLDRLVDWPLKYAEAAPLFCFGLLAEFDIPDLIDLAGPVDLRDGHRGPLGPSAGKGARRA